MGPKEINDRKHTVFITDAHTHTGVQADQITFTLQNVIKQQLNVSLRDIKRLTDTAVVLFCFLVYPTCVCCFQMVFTHHAHKHTLSEGWLDKGRHETD